MRADLHDKLTDAHNKLMEAFRVTRNLSSPQCQAAIDDFWNAVKDSRHPLTPAELSPSQEAPGQVADKLHAAQRCPNCPDQGWYVVANRNTGEPEQEQCQWCYETPDSLFNVIEGLRTHSQPLGGAEAGHEITMPPVRTLLDSRLRVALADFIGQLRYKVAGQILPREVADRLDYLLQQHPMSVAESSASSELESKHQRHTEGWVKEFVSAVEKLAFKIPAPNEYTPHFVMLCQEATRRLNKEKAAAPSPPSGGEK